MAISVRIYKPGYVFNIWRKSERIKDLPPKGKIYVISSTPNGFIVIFFCDESVTEDMVLGCIPTMHNMPSPPHLEGEGAFIQQGQNLIISFPENVHTWFPHKMLYVRDAIRAEFDAIQASLRDLMIWKVEFKTPPP
jgi:hypothetical protein